jgi:1-acyl-sn-glycerol-3-phosphate acyltransferase
VRLAAAAGPIAPGSLLVANHVSWLDAVAIAALHPAAFVVKDDVRRWPLIGRLLERNGALFLRRDRRRDMLRVNALIARRLAAGETVALFPEGTTTDGAGVLPFRPALFQPAVAGGHAIVPLALAYRDAGGGRSDAAVYVGSSLWQSLCAVAAARRLEIRIERGEPPAAGLTRKQSARLAREAIQCRLAGSRSPGARRRAEAAIDAPEGSGSPSASAPSSTAPIWLSRPAVSRT